MRAITAVVILAILGLLPPASLVAHVAGSESPRLLTTIDAPQGHHPARMIYMPDGREIATLYILGENGRRAKVELRDATTGDERLTFDVDVESSLGLAVTPDSSTLVTTNSRALAPELSGTGRAEIKGRIDLWDASTGKLKASLQQDGYWGFTAPSMPRR
jgi:hypothetical protein